MKCLSPFSNLSSCALFIYFQIMTLQRQLTRLCTVFLSVSKLNFVTILFGASTLHIKLYTTEIFLVFLLYFKNTISMVVQDFCSGFVLSNCGNFELCLHIFIKLVVKLFNLYVVSQYKMLVSKNKRS